MSADGLYRFNTTDRDKKFYVTEQDVPGLGTVMSLHVVVDSMPASGGGLTDAELRASPVEVSGNVIASGNVTVSSLPAISGNVNATIQGTPTVALSGTPAVTVASGNITVAGNVAVTGALTDAQLRATAVPVSGNIGVSGAVNPATYNGKTVTYVAVDQGAAGTTVLAAASPGNKHKLISCVLTLTADATLKFTDSSGDLTGAMSIVAKGGFVLPASIMPYLETGAANRALNLVTTSGAAKGVACILTEA